MTPAADSETKGFFSHDRFDVDAPSLPKDGLRRECLLLPRMLHAHAIIITSSSSSSQLLSQQAAFSPVDRKFQPSRNLISTAAAGDVCVFTGAENRQSARALAVARCSSSGGGGGVFFSQDVDETTRARSRGGSLANVVVVGVGARCVLFVAGSHEKGYASANTREELS